jgi:cardiolipin synthase A/B
MTLTIFWTVAITVLCVVLAMNFATPEKKLERKIERRYSARDPQFSREMSVLLGPTIVGGNRVLALNNGVEIFPAMLAAIRGAQQTILFETYIYWSGDIGLQLADALAERASSGVKVSVLIDWVGSLKMDNELLDRIQRAGAVVHRFRPLSWYNLGRLNNRTHRKLLVIDGQHAFTGGVGVADQWNGNAEDPDHWRDIHFEVSGPVVAHFVGAFNDNWMKATGEVLNGSEYFPLLVTQGDINAQLFLSSPSGGSESMHLMYLMAIASAEKTIDLQAAYFVPDELSIAALITARRRNVSVRVIVPGRHIDSETVRIASKGNWGDLLREGVEIYEYQPTMMHNKMLIIDTFMVSVGSTNFDLRSFRLNDEASLNLYDTDFATDMTKVFDADIGKTVQYSYERWLRRPLKQKLIEKIVIPLKSQL